jgi:uncharacterized membrane protein
MDWSLFWLAVTALAAVATAITSALNLIDDKKPPSSQDQIKKAQRRNDVNVTLLIMLLAIILAIGTALSYFYLSARPVP